MNSECTTHEINLLITDAVANLLYYDRKEDEEFPVGMIENLIVTGDITTNQMVDCFRHNIETAVQSYLTDQDK